MSDIVDPDLDLSQEADLELTDPFEIQRLLALLPKIIEKAEERIQQADNALENAQNGLDVAKAKAQLLASENTSLTAAPDRVAWARTQPDVMETHIDVINKKADVAVAKLKARKYENYYTSVRKAANIFEVLETASMAQQKYSS